MNSIIKPDATKHVRRKYTKRKSKPKVEKKPYVKLADRYPYWNTIQSKRGQMIQRCYSDKAHNSKYYKDRGIKVCDEWKNKKTGPMNFYNWCMENGYEKGMAISRYGDTGNYSPDNCKILTMSENSKEMASNNHLGIEIKLIKNNINETFNSIMDAAKWLISEGYTKTNKPATVAAFLTNTIHGYNNGKTAYGFKVENLGE